MSNNRTVWSDEFGDMRKKNKEVDISVTSLDETQICLELRRLTSGKGRTIIEIKGLPKDKKWCKNLAKDLKKKLGIGGTYKDDYIELHGEKIEKVISFLDTRSIKWKKTGG